MQLNRNSVFITAASLLTAAIPATANAESTGLEDMVGARAGQAEAAIQSRGYRFVRGEKGDDRSYSYWWNADRRQCVTIATMNGRYDSITPTTAPDCRQSASMRPRPDYGNQPAYRPDPGYESDRGYSRPSYRAEGGSNVPPGYRGPIVDGRSVNLGLVCFGDGTRDGVATGTSWT